MNPAHAAQEFATPDHRIVLRFENQPFTAKDVIDCAWFSGELESAWRKLLLKLRCEEMAAEREDDSDDNALQLLSEEFRYQHDLLTSEETEKWLSDRGLTEEEFVDYFVRSLCLKQFGELVDAGSKGNRERENYALATEEVKNALRAELWMSDEFDRLAQQFAWRLLASARKTEIAEADVEVQRVEFIRRHGISNQEIETLLESLDRTEGWLNETLKREAAFAQLAGSLLTPEQRAKALRSRLTGLTQAEIETLDFQKHEAAREALLCLNEKEATMGELAHQCGADVKSRMVFIEDCPDDVQHGLWSAAVGDSLLFRENTNSFVVCQVIKKIEPQLSDDEVRHRIDSKLLESGFADLAGKAIHWVTTKVRT